MLDENEKFKDFLLREAREDFDVYWNIEMWIDRKWDAYRDENDGTG